MENLDKSPDMSDSAVSDLSAALSDQKFFFYTIAIVRKKYCYTNSFLSTCIFNILKQKNNYSFFDKCKDNFF